ncbi:reverse transcriptase family protein [Mucilaginibacter ximonensis]|uniref:Reverse transcriptase family protein n=1 Tax=Mucilaginibacter ximonensis TaxID=538021 RepID=A0ABW5YB47_9SPHI
MNQPLFRAVNANPPGFYSEREQPKIKFGEEQIDEKGKTKMRCITKPIYTLKQYQRLINEYLKSIELPDSMFGGIAGTNNFFNAYEHRNSTHFLTIDLKNFFGNISNNRVHQTLIRKGLTWEQARFITRLTTLNNGLPQGAPTSTTLANIVFSDTALQLEKFCKSHNIVFTVFVDDLTFSSAKDFKHLNQQILQIISDNKFLINQKKIHYRKYHCEITGLFVMKGKISLPKNLLNLDTKPGRKAYIDHIKMLIDLYC